MPGLIRRGVCGVAQDLPAGAPPGLAGRVKSEGDQESPGNRIAGVAFGENRRAVQAGEQCGDRFARVAEALMIRADPIADLDRLAALMRPGHADQTAIGGAPDAAKPGSEAISARA